jgi:hypothetical protein
MVIDDNKEFRLVIPPTGLLTIRAAGASATNEIRFIVAQVPQEHLLPDVKEPKLVILKYEFEMYFIMRWMPGHEGLLRNAITEGACLHARNLCNFFCGSGEQRDIRHNQVFDMRHFPHLSALIKKLKKAYDKTNDGVNPRISFNRLIAHMTMEREKSASGYDYRREFDAVEPILRKIRDEVVRPYLDNSAAKDEKPA